MNVRVVLVAFTLTASSSAQDADPTRAAIKEVQGAWSCQSFTMGGQPLPAELTKTKAFAIRDNLLTWTENGKDITLTLTLTPTTNPKSADLSFVENGTIVPLRGIYKTDKDTLTLCFEFDTTAARPREFQSLPGRKSVLLTLQRVKK